LRDNITDFAEEGKAAEEQTEDSPSRHGEVENAK
jgi:hypothetical protein